KQLFLFSVQRLQLGHWNLQKLSAFTDELPGNGKGVLPAPARRRIIVFFRNVRHPCPADQNPSAPFILKGLWRIEIKALIPFRKSLQAAVRPVISLYMKITGGIHVLKFIF